LSGIADRTVRNTGPRTSIFFFASVIDRIANSFICRLISLGSFAIFTWTVVPWPHRAASSIRAAAIAAAAPR